MARRIFAVVLIVLALSIAAASVVLAANSNQSASLTNTPSPTPVPLSPTPTPVPTPVLTPKGQPAAITATAAILLDDNTDNILFSQDAHQPLPMASTTKIMTAIIAIQTGNLDQQVTIGQDAVNEVVLNGGSGAGLVAGDKLSLRDLLYGLMLPSGDDAAVAIADAIAGSVPNFVRIMNLEAQRLHLYQTHYANADGLEVTDSQGNVISGVHYTSAYDLVRLARYAMSIPLFAQIVQTEHYTVPASATNHLYKWTNINNLLYDYKGAIGIKTGWTPQAGGCLVFAARRNNQTLIGVVLHSSNETTRFSDATTLLNWGFALPLLPPAP
ncbi:MAG TPA: serine hydrolase [Ktedonobacteraceae bacterium]|nr:serine hydrolase [Ktedonobacteraceae bacterium]